MRAIIPVEHPIHLDLMNQHLILWSKVSGIFHFSHLSPLDLSYNLSLGPPQWLTKPADLHVGPKENFNIKCEGIGHPLPSSLWKKFIGELFFTF